jgi:hypothetical protein
MRRLTAGESAMKLQYFRHMALALLAIALFANPAVRACPFCAAGSTTLTQDASQATFIVFGTLSNPQFDPAATFQGTTDLKIETVVKEHEYIKGKDTITLNRYVAVDPKTPTKYLVFCDVFNGKLDAYRGVALKSDSKIAEYLQGALKIKEKDPPTRLAYFFNYLDSPDIDISNDAYGEFANADYKDYRPLAAKLPADKLIKWLQDENTPASRFGLYGSMLGHCGSAEHAKILRSMLDDPNKRFATGMDGMLAGYVMLQPKEGWDYVSRILKDRSKDFLLRYAALRTARFVKDFRPDTVPMDTIVDGVATLLDQEDIADLAIEDLRKWKRWELTDKILGLFDKKSHDIPIIKRAILRFMLAAASENAHAAKFVEAQRKRDAEWVKDVEELLLLEAETKPAPAKPAGKAPDK